MLQFISQFFNPKTKAASALQKAEKPIIESFPDSNSLAPEDNSAQRSSMLRRARLIMVTRHNNNKFYSMDENEDGTFTASYGRVGSSSVSRRYPISQWEPKLKEKLKKGYADTTHLFSTKQSIKDFLKIENEAVEALVEELIRAAKQSIFSNYHVMSEEVTMHQVKEAQAILDGLSKQVSQRMNLEKFNDELVELYAVIPRRMSRVKDHLIQRPLTKEVIKKIEDKLAEEQATLDVMRGQVEMHRKQETQEQQAETLLDAFGLQVEVLEDQKMIGHIKKMMGNKSGKFHRAYKVINRKTQKQFDRFLETKDDKQTALFWHGSRNENWLSIIKTGLVLRPANAVINGKMFGYGLYFADRCAKSLNYSSLSGAFWSGGNKNKGFLALYDVHIGKQLKIKRHASWCSQITASELKKRGDYDSVFAKGGIDLINNEYIVYEQAQCTVRYFVEVR